MLICHPKLSEIEEAISVLYSAFIKDFSYIFGEDYEYGRKLFVSFFKKTIKEKDLPNFLIAKQDNKIVGAVYLDYDNPKLVQFLFFFIRMNLHFLRSYHKFGLRKAFKITLGMYWFLFEDFNTNTCYIELLGVHPEYQNRKIGTKILQQVEKLTRQLGLPSMTLDVSLEDAPARHLYKKMGFIETRKMQISFLTYLVGIEGAATMVKKLT